MPVARTAQPIKLGVLMDYAISARESRLDIVEALELVFGDAIEEGLLDRPVELVYREVDGLPRGTVKAVVDAFAELADEGCVAVYGPNISDNAVVVREQIERRFEVPSISVCGSDDWLGEWTFSLPNGSMTDEPIIWAHLMGKAGQRTAGVLVERSFIGQSYLANFRQAARHEGITIVAEEQIAQTAGDLGGAVRRLHDAGVDAIVHCGFGLGIVQITDTLKSLDWDPPRYMGTALETGFESDIRPAFVGWIGLEQYDEGNPVGQTFLDRFAAVHGRRPAYFNPLMNRDVAVSFLHAFADARPLSPRGVRDALERVKMLPAACGSAGTRISFGRWQHRGWVGAGYLVARTLDPDGPQRGAPWATHLVGRYGQD
jgi:ABC-type branched-subunit amino acid transport system substrate-binding protein